MVDFVIVLMMSVHKCWEKSGFTEVRKSGFMKFEIRISDFEALN
jgi:hypothetical protein